MKTTARTARAALALAVAVLAVTLSGCGAAGAGGQPTSTSSGAAGDTWSIDAEFTAADGSVETRPYEPLATADVTKDWRICAVFPHVKDTFWVSANYGNTAEAERLGVAYDMFEAGGYANLSTQVNQMSDCIVQDYDAIILGAISGEGNCASIASALEAGIVVVDFINGTVCGTEVTSNPLYTRVLVSYGETADIAGQALVDAAGGDERRVGVFPGPEGAAFANDAVAGFTEAISGSSVTTEVVRRGDTGLDIQLDMITDALQAYPDLTDIFGVDIAAEAATVALRNAGRDDVGVYGYTIIPNLYDAIVNGEATGAVTDWTPYQGRIAIDQAIRILEGLDTGGATVGPHPEFVGADNAESISYEDMFGPRGFQPIYSVPAS